MPVDDHVAENRRYWNARAGDWVAAGERAWAGEPRWGQWGLAESELGLLGADYDGVRGVELGCGTGYVSGWLAARGAAMIGVDVSETQLATARRLAAEHGVAVDFVQADAERVCLRDGCADLVISEYGAALWCSPRRWLAEAHRLLRPGGEVLWLTSHPLVAVCSPLDGSIPVTEHLERPWFGLDRLDWTDAVDEPGGVEFNAGLGDWFALCHEIGFEVLDFRELRPPAGVADPDARPFAVTYGWARRFPSEMVWRCRRR